MQKPGAICHVLPEARVAGTLYYRSMKMALGAEVNGQLVHARQFPAAIPAPAPEKPDD